VTSGKGGVGKSVVSVSLALALAKAGYRVGLLDGDITGANIHDILGGEIDVLWDRDKLKPAEGPYGLKFLSVGHIAERGQPVLWYGKDCMAAVKQLIERTEWGSLDYLIIDTPPGMADEVKAILPIVDYMLIVSVPSALAKSKVERTVEAAREYQTPIIGVIMNMTKFICPSCGAEYRLFPEDYSFENLGIPTIAEIPFNPQIASTKIINEFPLEKVLEAMKKPVILEKRKLGLKARLLKFLLQGGFKNAP